MIDQELVYDGRGGAHRRWIARAMFAVWLCVVLFQAWTHRVWRDEVRALSVALQGNTVWAMLARLHGEGHPAVWYLLLRGAHALVPRPEVLLVVSVAVAAAAMLIVVERAPFSLPFLALLLLTRFSTYEYSVMARNYGISMLLLFAFAALYERHADRDGWPGVVLFLLANCNAHSALLAGGLLLFWFVDILEGEAAHRPRRLRMFGYNAALAALGVAVSFLTVYPPYNDAAVMDVHSITFRTVLRAIFLPSVRFNLAGPDRLALVLPLADEPTNIVTSLVLFGSTLGLIRRKGAWLAAWTTLVGLSLFFTTVYPGAYRHQALWLAFLICLYWLAAPANRRVESAAVGARAFFGWLSTAGTLLFVLVLLLQWPQEMLGVVSAPGAALDNRGHTMKAILAGHPELQQAVIIADPDYLVETLPYYVSNPTYLLREQRYGQVVHFTRQAQLELSLGDVLTAAQRLRQETGRPVVILLSREINPSLPAQVDREGYDWTVRITPEQARAFQGSTRLLQHYEEPAGTGEGYYVYVMDK